MTPPLQYLIEKYNMNHGPNGRFATGGGGAHGGGMTYSDASAYGVQPSGPSLTPDEKLALTDYSIQGYKDVNSTLRGQQEMTAPVLIQTGHIDSAIAKSKLTEDTTVYRGYSDIRMSTANPNAMIGAEITDNGFMSTSRSRATAELFSARATNVAGGKNPVVLEITVPKGNHALKLFEVIKTDMPEQEVLLPRGTRLKITGTEIRHARGQDLVYAKAQVIT